jgi:hypothetical protein
MCSRIRTQFLVQFHHTHLLVKKISPHVTYLGFYGNILDLIPELRSQRVNVCSFCGFTQARLSKAGVKRHQDKEHGGNGVCLRGIGRIIPSKGTYLESLLNTHIQEQVLSAHPRIIGTAAAAITENAIPLTPIKEEAVELSQIDRLKEICNNFLCKYSQELAKSSPSPKKRPCSGLLALVVGLCAH